MECHAFLCEKRKQAQNVTLAVARSFSMAYEAWRIAPKASATSPTKKPEDCGKIEQINQLIDLGGDFGAPSHGINKNQWVGILLDFFLLDLINFVITRCLSMKTIPEIGVRMI